ncbi:MAG: TonB family protein [Pyrinomonadaceae bacterium]
MKEQTNQRWLAFLLTAIVVIFGSSASAFAQDKLAKDYRGLPVTKQSLIKVLKSGEFQESEIIEIINENGVDFPLKPAVEGELKDAGAGDNLIAAVRQNYFVSSGVVNGSAANVVTPAYPPAASTVHASGSVNVAVIIDEDGNVIKAHAISGHPLLRQAAEEAARASTFSPTTLFGKKVRVSGIIVYNFVAR